MSATEDRKSKKRKQKKGPVAKTPTQNEAKCQSFTDSLGIDSAAEDSILSPGLDSETMQKLEKLMDADKDADIPQLLSLSRGPNPFLDKERCLLCGCERIDPPEAAALRANAPEKKHTDTNSLAQLPLWVCPDCRKSTEQGMDRRVNISSFMEEPDLPPEPSTLPFVDPALDSEPVSPTGTVCNCEACTERRQIEAEHDKETQELQNCWTELRKLVRVLYGSREGDVCTEEDKNIPDEDKAKELVHRLCARDPHQLFLRLESQVREFVIEMKVKLLKQLNSGYKTPPEAKAFIQLLLEEYGHLCVVSRKMAEILDKLKNEHLVKFHLTWELHNKHLFQSIAYTEPSIQSSLHLIISQLRLGAASKESYNEDTYPNLLHRYLKFDDEMSVISVVWRDSHQLIEQYNEEQSALKLKQKMLKEDWEFFKAQRKILEDHVAKNSKSPVSHSNFEAQFTETMRLMLTGSKPGPEECHCSRCNRKRCPCDECTITHMITCGIINPEALEATNTGHPTFLHDPNRYRIDVSPPSMSSTTSSSGSSSPILVDPSDRRVIPFDMDENQNEGQEEEEIQEEIDNNSQSGEGDDGDDDMDEDDDDDDDEDYDLDDEDDDEEDEEEEEEEEDLNVDTKKEELTAKLTEISSESWMNEDPDDDGAAELISEKCDCYHCVSQAQAEQMIKLNENSCQCYVCLRQKGQTISTSLPQQVTTETSRPGELHLYPHIHGSSGLHGLSNHHVRPLLPTQLYDLHMPPIRQPKPLLQTSTKVPLKLDFDSPEGIHEHIYHAYGEWDNTYDARMLLPKYTLGTELLPPPPLPANFPPSFLTEPFTQTLSDIPSTITPATSAFKTSLNSQVSFSATKGSDSTPVHSHDHTAPKVSRTEPSNKNLTPPCTRPVPLGGNISQQKAATVSSGGDKTNHSQHCRHHNSLTANKNNANFTAHNHTTQSSNLPAKVTQDFIQTAARNIRENAKEGMQRIRQLAANSLNGNVNNSHSCNHNPPNSQGHSHLPSADHLHTGGCPNAVSMATTVNNVSVGTSTVCMDQGCEGHFEDNSDSVDDSSEQSSTTSTSNQKEGKYCDCCYCEFFGHGNPPVAPTSKNYAEMRDRLRLRLKKKNEARQEDGVTHENCMRNNHTKSQKELESQGLDELIKYINGTDQKDSQNTEKSSKAAKRARQKQRKAEEKARLEAERIRQEQERIERERLEKEREKNMANAAKNEKISQKKKKKKEKAKLSEITESPGQSSQNASIIREPPVGQEGENKGKEVTQVTSCKSRNPQSAKLQKADSKGNELEQKSSQRPERSKPISEPVISLTELPPPGDVRVLRSKSAISNKCSSKDNRKVEDKVKTEIDCAKPASAERKVKASEQNDQHHRKGKRVAEENQCITNYVAEQSQKLNSHQANNRHQHVQAPRPGSAHLKPGEQSANNNVPGKLSRQQPQNVVKQQPQKQQQPNNINHVTQSTGQQTKQLSLQQQQQLVKQQIRQQAVNPMKVATQHAQQQLPQTKVLSQQHAHGKVTPQQHPTQGKVLQQNQPQHVNHQLQHVQPQKSVPQSQQARLIVTANKQSSQLPNKPANHQPQQPSGNRQMTTQNNSQQSPRSIQQSPRVQQKQVPVQNGSVPLPRQPDRVKSAPAPCSKGLQVGSVLQNGTINSGFKQPAVPSGVQVKSPAVVRRTDGKTKQEDSSPQDQKGTKSKKNKKKNRNSEDLTTVIDEIFLPKDLSEVENGDMDEVEKELEEFKRFCLDSTPVKREKLQVNMNLKDIFVKKKSGLGCS